MNELQKDPYYEPWVGVITLVEPVEFGGVVFIEGSHPKHFYEFRLAHVECKSDAVAIKEQLDAFLSAKPEGKALKDEVLAELERIRATLPARDETTT